MALGLMMGGGVGIMHTPHGLSGNRIIGVQVQGYRFQPLYTPAGYIDHGETRHYVVDTPTRRITRRATDWLGVGNALDLHPDSRTWRMETVFPDAGAPTQARPQSPSRLDCCRVHESRTPTNAADNGPS